MCSFPKNREMNVDKLCKFIGINKIRPVKDKEVENKTKCKVG